MLSAKFDLLSSASQYLYCLSLKLPLTIEFHDNFLFVQELKTHLYGGK